jgi:hypothetical protein
VPFLAEHPAWLSFVEDPDGSPVMIERPPPASVHSLPDPENASAVQAWVESIEADTARVFKRRALLIELAECEHRLFMLKHTRPATWRRAQRVRAWVWVLLGLVLVVVLPASAAVHAPSAALPLAGVGLVACAVFGVAGLAHSRWVRARLVGHEEVVALNASRMVLMARLEETAHR